MLGRRAFRISAREFAHSNAFNTDWPISRFSSACGNLNIRGSNHIPWSASLSLLRWASTMHRTSDTYQVLRVGISLLAIFAVGTMGPAFAQDAAESREPPVDRAIAKLDDELDAVGSAIEREVGDPIAQDPSQCAVLPMGARPCGGPAKYLAYSHQASDTTLLTRLGDQYTRLQFARHVLTQAGSDCSISQPPTAVIIDGRCRLSYGK